LPLASFEYVRRRRPIIVRQACFGLLVQQGLARDQLIAIDQIE